MMLAGMIPRRDIGEQGVLQNGNGVGVIESNRELESKDYMEQMMWSKDDVGQARITRAGMMRSRDDAEQR